MMDTDQRIEKLALAVEGLTINVKRIVGVIDEDKIPTRLTVVESKVKDLRMFVWKVIAGAIAGGGVIASAGCLPL